MSALTVKELIDLLAGCPDELQVFYDTDDELRPALEVFIRPEPKSSGEPPAVVIQ